MAPKKLTGKETAIPAPPTTEAEIGQTRTSAVDGSEKGSETSSVRKEGDDDNMGKGAKEQGPASGAEHVPTELLTDLMEQTLINVNQRMLDGLSFRMEEVVHDMAQKVTTHMTEVMKPMSLTVQQNSENMAKQYEKLVSLLSERLEASNDRPAS